MDFNDNLTLGGPPSIGYGKANLSPEVLSALTEVAVSEQVRTRAPAKDVLAFEPIELHRIDVLKVIIQHRLPMRALQGHGLFTRHAGGALPCPLVNYTAGFNDVYANIYGLAPGQDISVLFGAPFGKAHLPYCTVHFWRSLDFICICQQLPYCSMTWWWCRPAVQRRDIPAVCRVPGGAWCHRK